MSVRSECPKRDALQALARGLLPGHEAARVLAHVEECERCRATLAAFTPAPRTDAGAAAAPVATQAIRRSVPASDVYSFLNPPLEPDELGRLGNYRVLELLGKGGMGFVFRGEDVALRRPVAIKVMRPDMKHDAHSGDRFIREAQTLAKIKHDHLVTIYSAAQDGDIIYFAMELLEGQSLEAWMHDLGPADLAETVRIGREIASGLAVIHGKKLIHRDIKPANIWLKAPARRIKILDLGLARPDQDNAGLTDTGIILGTPDYMSPEQARGKEVGDRSDLFSLGGILYRLCTGRPPFTGDTVGEILIAVATETPVAPIKYNPQLPEALSNLVMQLLARDPADRPESAEAVVQTLDEIEFERRLNPPDRTTPMKLSKAPKAKPKRVKAPVAVPWWRQPLVLALLGMGGLAGLGGMATVIFGIAMMAGRPVAPRKAARSDAHFLTDMKEIARQNWPFEMHGPPREGKEDDEFKGFKEFKKKKKGFKDDKVGPKDFDQTVRVRGQRMPHGVFMHPPVPPHEHEPASLTYRLDKQFTTFEAEVSLNDRQENEAGVTFVVYGDGKLLWESPPVTTAREAHHCSISVRGVAELKIQTTCPGPPDGAHGIWIEPFLTK